MIFDFKRAAQLLRIKRSGVEFSDLFEDTFPRQECFQCRRLLNSELFWSANVCRLCHRKTSQAWKDRNPTRAKELARRSAHAAYIRNPNAASRKWAHCKRGYLKRQYGITVEDFSKMLVRQNNKCAICQLDFTKAPCVDHCHNTGQVRGLLCKACNSGIGQLSDDVDRLRAAISYLLPFVSSSVK